MKKTEQENNHSKELSPILMFCAVVFAIGLATSMIYAATWSERMTSVVWILACSLSGSFIGFLFGIPKILQTGQSPAASNANGAAATPSNHYQQLVNTNLTEISDWLTKIIVGLGLVKLTKLPPYLHGLAEAMTAGLNKNPNSTISPLSFAYGIIVCFFVLGFLFGYLFTRLYLATLFSKVDQESLSDFKTLLNNVKTQGDIIEANQAVTNAVLYPDHGEAAPQASIAAGTAKLNDLKKQADSYLHINASNYGERVRLKEQCASQMANYALSNKISKDDIITLNADDKNEGLIITLATLVIFQPEPADTDRLLKAGADIERKHVRYRILVAISKLLSQKMVKFTDKDKILDLINKYRKNADDSLLEKIQSVTELTKNYKC